jgi:hypothetical protein
MSLKQFRYKFQEKLKLLEKETRTYEQICLEKLRELGKSTAAEWSTAMGYSNPNALSKVIRRIKIKAPDKLKIYYNRRPRQYEAL